MKTSPLAPALAFSLLLLAPARADNLLVNPGFESGDLSAWTTFGFGWRLGTGEDAHSGTYGLLVTDDLEADTDIWRGIHQEVPVSPRLTYSASVAIRAVKVRYSSAWLEINWLDDKGHVINQIQSRHVTRDQKFTPMVCKKIRAPAGAASASLRGIFFMPAKPRRDNAFFIFDDFVFEPD